MRLTVRSNLAMRILMDCAVHAPRMLQAAEIARHCNASVHHVAQVVSALAEAGIVATTRGRGGGLGLARPAGEIRIGAVLRLFEGPVPLTECMDALRNSCPLAPACRLRPALCRALDRFYEELDGLTLQDLVAENAELAAILGAPPRAEGTAAAGAAG